jgi:peptide/nickel transport system ATP-binding protein
MTALLEIAGLGVCLTRGGRALHLVEDVSFSVHPGECLGLVGESGSGKTMTALAVLGLFPAPEIGVTAGSIRLQGQELRDLSPAAWRAVRGRQVGIVFQDPSSFLDPLMPVGRQIAEVLRTHRFDGDHAGRVRELLAMTELPDPDSIARRYPYELSGGMRQRVLIAAALAMNPSLLIADEPTTALDVTVQAGILDLLSHLRKELGLGVLLITHDLGVVARSCQRVAVMYAGRMVEENAVRDLFAHPRHPYTQGLLRSTLLGRDRAGEMFCIPGTVPGADAMPRGCRFHPRCPVALPEPCMTRLPELMPRVGGGADACWRAEEKIAADPWSHAA